jgi:hypothetical protein
MDAAREGIAVLTRLQFYLVILVKIFLLQSPGVVEGH